jgi:hypothetical protein
LAAPASPVAATGAFTKWIIAAVASMAIGGGALWLMKGEEITPVATVQDHSTVHGVTSSEASTKETGIESNQIITPAESANAEVRSAEITLERSSNKDEAESEISSNHTPQLTDEKIKNTEVVKTDNQGIDISAQHSNDHGLHDGPAETSPSANKNIPSVGEIAFTSVAMDKDSRQYFFMPSYTDAQGYYWEFGNGESSDVMSPSFQYTADGEYEIVLTITFADGSQRTIERMLVVNTPGKLDIPQNVIITPNGDGLNDLFDLKAYAEGIDFVKIQIRNQAGAIVFDNNGNEMWKGNDMSGAPCPSGYYQFLIRGTDRNQDLREKRGLVYLQR